MWAIQRNNGGDDTSFCMELFYSELIETIILRHQNLSHHYCKFVFKVKGRGHKARNQLIICSHPLSHFNFSYLKKNAFLRLRKNNFRV